MAHSTGLPFVQERRPNEPRKVPPDSTTQHDLQNNIRQHSTTSQALHYKVLLPIQHGGLRKHQCYDHILHIKAKHANVKASYAFYIDFNKAWNSVPHRELFQVLEHNRFSTAAIDIIKRLYSTPLNAPIINGQTPVQYFYRRGVRQGCPLSPPFFILYLNALLAHFMATPPTPSQQNLNTTCLCG